MILYVLVWFCKLGTNLNIPGKRDTQLRDFFQQTDCGHVYEAFCWLLTDVEGLSPLWAGGRGLYKEGNWADQ